MLADITMSSFWILLQLRMEVVLSSGAIRRAKLQSYHHNHQTNIQLSTGQMPFLLPNQQGQSTEMINERTIDLLLCIKHLTKVAALIVTSD